MHTIPSQQYSYKLPWARAEQGVQLCGLACSPRSMLDVRARALGIQPEDRFVDVVLCKVGSKWKHLPTRGHQWCPRAALDVDVVVTTPSIAARPPEPVAIKSQIVQLAN